MSNTKKRPTVSEIVRAVGVLPSELAAAAKGLSLPAAKHITAGHKPGVTHAKKVTDAFTALCALYEGKTRRCEAAAWKVEMRGTPVKAVIRWCDAGPTQLNRLNPSLNLHTLKSVYVGRLSGNSLRKEAAAALRRLAAEHLITAGRCAVAAHLLSVYYPNGEPPPVLEPKNDQEAHIVMLAKQGVSFASIGRGYGIGREAVSQRIERYEKRTGDSIPRYGKV